MEVGFCRVRFTQNNQLIEPDAAPAVSHSAQKLDGWFKMSGAPIDNDEIIAKSVHF
jgi:hypothetical protein